MRILTLSAAALMLSAAPAAFANCNGPYCTASTHNAHSSSYNYTMPSTRYSSSAIAPLSSYSGHTGYTSHSSAASYAMSDHEADMRYGSGSVSQSYKLGENTVVPFTTTTASDSGFRIPGLGANEFLSPTECPVSVYNPEGGKVLGCYSVSKPAPVKVTVPSYHTVRVVRPIIYVRYPVPTPVPVPVYTHQYNYAHSYHQSRACGAGWASRYGENWPGRPCW